MYYLLAVPTVLLVVFLIASSRTPRTPDEPGDSGWEAIK